MEPSWTGVSDSEEGCGERGTGRDRMYPYGHLTVSSPCPRPLPASP